MQTHFVDGLGPLEGAERKELELVVEKTDGELKVHIRHDDEAIVKACLCMGFVQEALQRGR